MREILFRGKRLDNGEWAEGCLITSKFKPNRKYIVYLFSDDDHDIDVVEVDHETVGQYTGLKDQECRKIFEGDIIKLHNGIDDYPFPVVNKCGAFWLYDKTVINAAYPDDENAGLDLLGSYITNVLEVIGNVYDNPELLEVKQNND